MDTYRWHRGKLTDIHKGKFLKRGEGRGKRGEKRERVTPGLPD